MPQGAHYSAGIFYLLEDKDKEVAIVRRSLQDIHIVRWSFRRSGCETTSSAFVYFCARVLLVYDYSSSGQAIFYKSIARVKGDVSVN